MNDELSVKVRSAAISGWWTLLIGAAFLTVQWLAYLAIMNVRPGWVAAMWGGEDWATIQSLWLRMAAVFKLCLWLAALPVIWLSLWARKLRRATALPT